MKTAKQLLREIQDDFILSAPSKGVDLIKEYARQEVANHLKKCIQSFDKHMIEETGSPVSECCKESITGIKIELT